MFSDILRYETEQKKKVVHHNGHYLAFVLYAAGAEHEVWIVPKLHKAGLHAMQDQLIDNLAARRYKLDLVLDNDINIGMV